MSKKAKKKSSSSKAAAQGAGGDDDAGVVDERFVAAMTRPQFHKNKAARNNGSSTTTTTNARSSSSNNRHRRNGITQSQQEADHDDDDEVADAATTLSLAGGGGGGNIVVGSLGDSLTQAIRSDDRFRAALLDSEKFGCVPERDKYGRKTKTATNKKKNKNNVQERNDDLCGEVDDGVDGDRGDGTKKEKNKDKHDDSIAVDINGNSIEARIAYLNALSRGDISGSSSSDDSSSDDGGSDEENDHDDILSTSSPIQGTSGIFDPSHKSTLPGDNDGDDDAPEDETDEPSPYLCILNLNWEHVRAKDVFAMLHSFCPPGTLKKVEVYPSDFGRERMEKERVEGPPSGIWKNRTAEKGEKKNVEDNSSEEFSDGDNNEINCDDDNGDDEEEEEADESDEDVLDLTDATSKLYAHFPPQSTVMKNSKLNHDEEEEEGFDIEKLREYEASKLRYYFAIATFSTCEAASQVYDNVDGMEMEDSAAEIDARVLPQAQYLPTIRDRAVRDSCDRLPAKYIPPENAVAAALKQSRVTCSWERGDADRERTLTRYGMGKEAWEALATGEDIKLYLATSDNSSCSSGGDSDNSDNDVGGEPKSDANEETRSKKGSSMRKLLGLETSDSEGENDGTEKSLVGVGTSDDDDDDDDDSYHVNSCNETEYGSNTNVTTARMNELTRSDKVAFVPGQQSLGEKIRAKIKHVNTNYEGAIEVDNSNTELSPFQKYLQKRKEKKKERRQASQNARRNGEQHVDKGHSSREELELLLAGDDEHAKGYDIRGLAKLERHSNKKLKGRRKRQLESLAANVSGQDFSIDVSDNRFAALLDGTNDLYGIDRTHPAFRETGAMKAMMQERLKRKKENRDGFKMESGGTRN